VTNKETAQTGFGAPGSVRPRVLIGKTSLDGHWRGVNIVANALRDGGFEVLLAGMVTGDELAATAVDEDVDLVGLNVGGRIEIAERVVATLRSFSYDGPVFAGGTLAPYAVRRLSELGVECYPPGSSLDDIVEAARRLTATPPETEGNT
jgi:methylmalonyl-CoA mutase C-terminal domain/subunit